MEVTLYLMLGLFAFGAITFIYSIVHLAIVMRRINQ